MNQTNIESKLLAAELNSNYTNLNIDYSSKSNTTTNTSSSSNSLAFNEDDDDDEYNALPDKLVEKQTDVEECFSMLRSHTINTSSQLTSLTSSLIRTNPSSSSSSSSSSSANEAIDSQKQPPQSLNTKYIFILNAFVNGFAQLKLCANRIDYEYIIEIYWSNETKSFIKRTYEDFVTFHRQLLQMFSQFFSQIKSNVNEKSLKKSATNNYNNNNKKNNLGNMNDEYLMPILPANKKPFWVSHLKLAESREIELNSYVQRLLKLPTKISHSELVLKFFESQSSDPKPAKLPKYNVKNTNIKTDMKYDYENTPEHMVSDFGIGEEEANNYVEYEDDEDDDDEEEDEEEDSEENDSYEHNFNNINNYNNLVINSSSNSRPTHSIKKKISREAGLWWDEDEALNELTSSMSFEFGNHSQPNYNIMSHFDEANDDGSDELETLKTLEKILKNSDLFKADLRDMTISSASTTMLSNASENQSFKRLSLC